MSVRFCWSSVPSSEEMSRGNEGNIEEEKTEQQTKNSCLQPGPEFIFSYGKQWTPFLLSVVWIRSAHITKRVLRNTTAFSLNCPAFYLPYLITPGNQAISTQNTQPSIWKTKSLSPILAPASCTRNMTLKAACHKNGGWGIVAIPCKICWSSPKFTSLFMKLSSECCKYSWTRLQSSKIIFQTVVANSVVV